MVSKIDQKKYSQMLMFIELNTIVTFAGSITIGDQDHCDR